MSERSEHLIERAAAKLRAANAAQVPDSAAPGAQMPTGPAGGNGSAAPAFQPLSDRAAEASKTSPLQTAPLLAAPPPVARKLGVGGLPVIRTDDDPPELVPGPIPSPAPPLTRPIIQPVQPPLTISPGPAYPGQGSPGPNAPSPQPRAQQTGPQQTGLQQAGLQQAGLLAAGPAVLEGQGAAAAPAMALPRPGAAYGPRGPALTSLGFDMPSGLTQNASAGSALALQPPPIVQLDALERAGMVVARTTRTRISEEYRIAIGRILRVLHETTDIQGARNVLMVTSARPGEGKSFTALNLAGSIAQNGTDAVLLVDVDPKVKPLSDQLGLGEVQGFLDLVSDPSLRPEDLLRVTAIPNMAILPVGTRLGGAAQTIGGTASMRPIIPTITRLARRFPKHLIMLDAPPCLSTSDPHTLAPHVGQVVLVVEAERTQRSEVEAAVDLVRVCPSITLLLNKVRMTTSHTFGAYDYFGSYT